MFDDTIFALSSGRLPSGVAIIRLSGSQCRFVCETVAGGLSPARQASFRQLRARNGEILDAGLVLWFPGPYSFTGEDCLELHLHGGIAVVKAVLDDLSGFDRLRPAEAGEFTRRAFLNGKFDLVQAEALSDLISAETEAQRRFALRNSEGRQTDLYESWRHRLVSARASIEAELDFSDEGDVPEHFGLGVLVDLQKLVVEMEEHCQGYRRAEMIRDGFDIVLAGAPNAGKSSLLNALARRPVAIVSPEAGTTRDLIEVTLDLDGYKVRITDTAGLRDAQSKVEALGIERARNRIAAADLVLQLVDLSDPVINDRTNRDCIRVGTKLDLVDDTAGYDVCVSAISGDGISALLQMIVSRIANEAGNIADVMPSQQRHVALIRAAQDHIQECLDVPHASDLMAESLRLASDKLGRISGRIDVEDVLDVIFSRFCIGK